MHARGETVADIHKWFYYMYLRVMLVCRDTAIFRGLLRGLLRECGTLTGIIRVSAQRRGERSDENVVQLAVYATVICSTLSCCFSPESFSRISRA